MIDVRNELENVQRKLARTERALESLSRILSLVPDPIEVVSPDYTVLFANRASRLLHDNDRLEGSFYYQTVMGLDEPPQECPIKRAVEDDREAAYTASCENGDVFDVAVTPIVLADGRRAALSMSKPVVLGVAAESKPGDTEESDEVATATAPLPAGDADEKDLEDACEPTAGNEEEQIQILQRIAELSSLTLDAVLAQVTDGVLLANTNGQPILYNDAFTRLTGFGSPSPEAAVLS
ncbi:MAG: PAS domain-containing protein, partial [Candidatus Krumholzibacteria bacterium]|nr:PAS domain-containing protein [Candidatus Krumholzibacteria bacterium]